MGCAVSNLSMPVPGGFIHKTPSFCVHQDPLIPIPGFLVIASVRHIQSIADMTPREYKEFAALVKTTHSAVKAATGTQQLTLIQEESSAHFHLWFFPWAPSIIQTYGQPSLSKIRAIMADYRQHPISPAEWKELEKSIEKIKTCWANN